MHRSANKSTSNTQVLFETCGKLQKTQICQTRMGEDKEFLENLDSDSSVKHTWCWSIFRMLDLEKAHLVVVVELGTDKLQCHFID